MRIKYCEPFIKQKENIEYIEALCKRYLQVLNTKAVFFESDICNSSKVKAELKRVGKSLRLASIELEKGLK